MTFEIPCRRPENDSQDWFIDKTGRQYHDDILVSVEDLIATIEDRTTVKFVEGGVIAKMPDADEVLVELEEEVLRLALIRRRHAKDKCFVECILREHCLDAGLEEPHGTWGGYFEEERRKIVELRDKRRKKSAAQEE